ncbi:MAG: CoA transferase [Streptosporangiales bacterium]|nr:CoA transferase [Streptosporangiales bacterium]
MLPLNQMRVLDLTRFLSGPYCTMTLGDMGADVVKVERPPAGDDVRALGPYVNGESYCFAMVNRNKRSIGLDVSTPRGRDVLMAIARTADVVVENFRPGVTERLGIDYASVRAERPDVVYCSITGFGQDGPYRDRPGFDIIAQGLCGFLRMTGQPDERPAKVGFAVNDLVAGTLAVQAVLAAYIHRLQTGEGQYIDLSLVEAGLALTVWEAAAYFGSGELPEQSGTRHRRNAPYQAYRTSDGYVTIGGNTEPMWRVLCTDVLKAPELLADPRYADKDARLANVEALEADIERVTVAEPTRTWVERMDAAGVPGGPVLRYDEALADEHMLARGMVTEVEHPTMGTIRTLVPAAKLSATPLRLRLPSPGVGEHTGDVLTESGLTAAQVGELFDDGTVYDAARSAKVVHG